jgi:hypothetical protein
MLTVTDTHHEQPPQPQYGAVPPIAARRRRKWVLPVVLSAVGLMVVGFIGLSIFGFVMYISHGIEGAGGEHLVEGEPGPIVAESPLDCPGTCFVGEDLQPLVISEDVAEEFGTPTNEVVFDDREVVPVTVIHEDTVEFWIERNGDPDECFFAVQNAPLAFGVSETVELDDRVHYLSILHDEESLSIVDQSVRIFPDSASAVAYLAGLSADIKACTFFATGELPNDNHAYVSPAPAIELPESVAAVGWVRLGDRPGPFSRNYVIDLQRGNIVVRIRMATDGSITEMDYRALVEQIAIELGGLPPTSG